MINISVVSPIRPHLSSLPRGLHFVTLIYTLTYEQCLNVHPWRLIVRIQPALGVERPEHILAVVRAGDERASWGWGEILNPYSILRATGNH